MSVSTRMSPSRSCRRWCSITMLLVLKTSGLSKKTETPSREFCKIFLFLLQKIIYYTMLVHVLKNMVDIPTGLGREFLSM